MGLYTGFFALLVYALLGQCGQLSIGPDAMTAMLVRSFLTSFATDKDLDGLDPVVRAPCLPSSLLCGADQAAVSIVVRSQTMANGLAILVGIFLTILGMCRFGFIDNILSKAVLRGFVTAVAFIIMIEQLPALLGIAVPKSTSDSLFACAFNTIMTSPCSLALLQQSSSPMRS
jgi:MFS superfamily sulfate permease-like transporter